MFSKGVAAVRFLISNHFRTRGNIRRPYRGWGDKELHCCSVALFSHESKCCILFWNQGPRVSLTHRIQGVWSPVWSAIWWLWYHVLCWCWWWSVHCVWSSPNTSVMLPSADRLYISVGFPFQQHLANAHSVKMGLMYLIGQQTRLAWPHRVTDKLEASIKTTWPVSCRF